MTWNELIDFLPLKTAVNGKFGGGGQMTNDANFPGFLSFFRRLWQKTPALIPS